MARPKGSPKYGGRQPGTPNKATTRTREAIAAIAEDMSEKFKQWVIETAEGKWEKNKLADGTEETVCLVKPDPKGAADLYLKAIEYHIPKLARSELTGADGQPLLPPSITICGYDDNQADETAA